MSSPLDDHIRAVLDRVRVSLSGQLEADLTASTADILRAVGDEQRQTLVEATERTATETRLEAEQQLSHLRDDFERAKEELRQAAASEISGLERTLADARDELEVSRRNLHEAQSARDALEHQLEQTKRDEEISKRELQDAIERASRGAEESRLETDATTRELERLRARLAHSIRLAAAFRTLDEATSLGDILEHLAQSVCQETGRTAVFLVNGERLRGWRALGFQTGALIVGSEFEPADEDVVGQAVRLGVGQQHRNGDTTHLPAFAAADSPRDALAVPVQVGGSVIAVLYADAARADSPEDPEWLDMMDAMAKHAGRVLEAMTVRQAAALWAPRPGARRPSREGGERSSPGVE